MLLIRESKYSYLQQSTRHLFRDRCTRNAIAFVFIVIFYDAGPDWNFYIIIYDL